MCELLAVSTSQLTRLTFSLHTLATHAGDGGSARDGWRIGNSNALFSPMTAPARHLAPLDAVFGVGRDLQSVGSAAEMHLSWNSSTGYPWSSGRVDRARKPWVHPIPAALGAGPPE